MWSRFLTFFIIGAALGRHFDAPLAGWRSEPLVYCVVSIGGCCALWGRLQWAKPLLLVAGLGWGLSYSAPYLGADAQTQDYRVAKLSPGASLAATARGAALVETASGELPSHRLEAVAPWELGASLKMRRTPFDAGLWSGARGRLTRSAGQPTSEASRLAGWAAALRLQGAANLGRNLHSDRQRLGSSWFRALLFADRRALPAGARDSLRSLSMMHLVAASGLHVAVLVAAAAWLVRAPLQMAYALTLLSPRQWRHVVAVGDVLSPALGIFYLAMVEATPAAQRAVLGFGVMRLARALFGVPHLALRLQITAVLQALLFPIGFISEALLMSWGATLLVIAAFASRPERPRRGEPPPARWRSVTTVLQLQGALTVLSAACYGGLSWAGLVANLLLVPVFPLLAGAGLLVAIWPGVPLRFLVLELGASYLELLMRFSTLPMGSWPLPTTCRVVALGLAAALMLNACRRVSIRAYEPH